jgi:hypothetical protein
LLAIYGRFANRANELDPGRVPVLADSLNAVRWAGKRQRGFYEVWYMTLVDPATQDAYWFRYTVDAPTVGETEVGMWAFVSPAKTPRTGLTLHDRWPLTKLTDKSTEEKGFKIELGKLFLERNRATGKVGTGERSVEWDLKWEPNGTGFEHVSPALQAVGFAKSSVNSAHLAVEMEGTIKIGGKPVKVSKWPGHQSHTWGSKHADEWAWAHCNAFAEDKTAVFEGVSARVRKLGVLLPAATPLYLRVGGVEHTFSGVVGMWGNKSTKGRSRWEFEAENQEVLVKGVATAAAERMIGVEYADPVDGARLFCDHATAGDLSLEVWNRVGMRWELAQKLTSTGTTAFELCGRERNPDVGRSLDLKDTRTGVDEPEPKPAPKPAPAAAAPAAAPKT